MTLRRAAAIWALLALVALGVLLAALMLGSVGVTPWQVVRALSGAADTGVAGEVVLALRLPRALTGFACGGLLALAGALLQVLLRNPLADPYVLGASGGAATFALAAMLLALPAWSVDAAAFAGALATLVLVLGLAHGDLRHGMPATEASPRLLLAGVVIAAGWGALITLLLSLAPDGTLRGMVFWLAGDLDAARRPLPGLVALALALLAMLPAAPQLNALLRGEASAQALGVAVAPLRLRIYLVASFATAAAVATAGTVGFVGLVIPHLLRLAWGNDQRMLLPAAVLAGGTLVMLADLLARTVVAPAQLPVGAITALIGVPVFLWMLLRRSR